MSISAAPARSSATSKQHMQRRRSKKCHRSRQSEHAKVYSCRDGGFWTGT